MVAIAEYSGEGVIKPNKLVRIVSCPDESLVGREWLVSGGVPSSEGDFFVIKFEPADQFCKVIPLASVVV